MRKQILICLAMFVAAAASSAQDQNSGAEPTAVDDQRAPVPALLSGDAGSLAFTSELERSNYLRGGVTVGASYDDNTTNSVTNRIGDFSYSVLPNIALDQTRSRMHWVMSYAAGFVANQHVSERNQGSHDLSGSFDYRLSPHIDLHLADSFLKTTGFLQQFRGDVITPVTGPVTQPNPTVITPLANSLSNTASVNLTYQFSAGNMIGGGGTFFDSHFSDAVQGSPNLIDTTSRTADVFYTHRFTPRNWTGITYKFQNLSFAPGSNNSRTQSLLLSHTIYLNPAMTIAVYAGPEYTELDVQTVTFVMTLPVVSLATVSSFEHQWSFSAGGSFGWQGEHTSLRLEASRALSDGGGLQGSVLLNTVSGAARRQLSRFSTIDLSAIFGRSSALGLVASGQTPLTSVQGTVGFEQRLGQNLSLRLAYGRDYQEGSTFTPNGGNINHNRGVVSLSYNFTRPLGR